MAKLKQPTHVRKLLGALETALRKAGIRAFIDTERIPATKLHRIVVLTEQFEALSPSERQNLVWRIAQQVLDFDEQLLVSSILTLTPEEAGITAHPTKKAARRRKAI